MLSCSRPPGCNYSGADTERANAGCLVVNAGTLLVIEDNSGRFSVPGGSAGYGEVAQCTAEREVWEETGVAVVAGEKVTEFENGFQLFSCDIDGSMDAEQVLDGSARPSRGEIRAVHWLSAEELDDKNWRFPSQLPLMKNWLENSSQAVEVR